MKKLIEALHVIQNECNKQNCCCEECPLFSEKINDCAVKEEPNFWKINDEVQKALL